ncbi:MAG TPA: hypothetical protein VH500_19470 [Nitrososphaeraceae archaeon]
MISEEIDAYIDTVVPSLIGNVLDLCTSKKEIFEAIKTMSNRLYDAASAEVKRRRL